MHDLTAEFSTNWVKAHHETWLRYLADFAFKPGVRALEIGSWEGRSACWFCEHILTAKDSTLDCVDSWKGFANQEKRFDKNTAKFGSKVRKNKSESIRWCAEKNLQSSAAEYDFIYVDGSHEAQDVIGDLVLCWPLLRSGGLMICDDYVHADPALRRQPQVAIDAFFSCCVDWKVLHQGSQFIVQKTNGLLPLADSTNSTHKVNDVKKSVRWEHESCVHSTEKASGRGVLTSASSPYWWTLKQQFRSCREAGVDLAVANQGLLSWQVDWLVDNGAVVLTIPRAVDAFQEQSNFDLTWDKPAICRMSPFEETIWIDADAVPLRHLDRMFEYLGEGPWLSLENFVSEVHARQIYLKMVHSIYGKIPANYSHVSRINTGVFGFRKGDQWINNWASWCDRILASSTLKKMCHLNDQHAIVAQLCGPQTGDQPRIHEDRTLNWPANGLNIKESAGRKLYPWNDTNCLELLRKDHPEASVVHWLGRPKPFWKATGEEDRCAGTR